MRTRPPDPDLALAFACLLALLLFLMGLVLPQAHLRGSFLVPIVFVFFWGRRRDIYVVTAIAKEAVGLYGGTVAVESQVGVGTEFIVTLPRRMETA